MGACSSTNSAVHQSTNYHRNQSTHSESSSNQVFDPLPARRASLQPRFSLLSNNNVQFGQPLDPPPPSDIQPLLINGPQLGVILGI